MNLKKKNQVSKYLTILRANINIIQQNKYQVLLYVDFNIHKNDFKWNCKVVRASRGISFSLV